MFPFIRFRMSSVPTDLSPSTDRILGYRGRSPTRSRRYHNPTETPVRLHHHERFCLQISWLCLWRHPPRHFLHRIRSRCVFPHVQKGDAVFNRCERKKAENPRRHSIQERRKSRRLRWEANHRHFVPAPAASLWLSWRRGAWREISSRDTPGTGYLSPKASAARRTKAFACQVSQCGNSTLASEEAGRGEGRCKWSMVTDERWERRSSGGDDDGGVVRMEPCGVGSGSCACWCWRLRERALAVALSTSATRRTVSRALHTSRRTLDRRATAFFTTSAILPASLS